MATTLDTERTLGKKKNKRGNSHDAEKKNTSLSPSKPWQHVEHSVPVVGAPQREAVPLLSLQTKEPCKKQGFSPLEADLELAELTCCSA